MKNYQRILESAKDIIGIVNEDFVIEYLNEKALKTILGYSISDGIGKSGLEFVHPDDVKKAINSLKKGLEFGQNSEQIRFRHKNGQYIWFEATGNVFKDEKGQYKRSVILRDIHQKKMIEEKLKASEEKYKLISENANDLIRLLNSKFEIEYINENAHKKFLGYTKNDLIGKFAGEFLHPNDFKELDKQLTPIIRSGSGIREARVKHKNGNWVWFEFTNKIILDKDGNRKFLSISRDITEKKNAETKLKESEEKYRLISENAYDLIVILDKQFRYEYINEITFLHILGYSKTDLIGKSVLNFIHPDDIELAVSSLKEGFEKGRGSADIRFKHKNGKWVWLEAKGKTFLDQDGRMKAHIISRDITEKKITEQKLMESEEKFRTIAEQSSLGIIILQDGFIKYANKAISEITGYSAQDFKHWPQNEFLKKIYIEDQAIVIENLKKKLEGKTDLSSHYNCRIITSANEIKWIDLHSKRINYKGVSAILASFIDISEIKLAEKRLKESEVNFRELYEEAPYAYLSVGADSTILRGNNAALNLLGYSKQELMNMKVFDLYADTPSGLSRSKEIFKHFLKGEEIKNIELQMEKKNGERIWVSLSVKPIFDQSGKVIESRSMVIDITDRKNAEQKLRDSEQLYREAYDRANFYKDLFTHDINNILQIINSSAELISYQLSDTEDNLDIKNIADIIKKQVQRGAKLVGNVRTLSEIEEISLKIEPIDVCKVLASSIDYLHKAYAERNVNIQVNCEEDKYEVHGNELLNDVFDNLLINAIKYNQNLEVEIIVNILRELKRNINYIKIEIIDNAVGISDPKKEILFKEGYRIEKGTKGMGLGLSLVHKIIQMYKGEIWVENRFKEDFTKGSKFVILIPEFN
ncbi:MAG: PAS domain S-box protein [Promethearchaeota archaeon]